MNLNSPPIEAGPLTAADLDSKTNTGRIYHLHRAALLPAGCDQQSRHETRPFGASAYGDDMTPMPKVLIPLSRLARWALALRDWLRI